MKSTCCPPPRLRTCRQKEVFLLTPSQIDMAWPCPTHVRPFAQHLNRFLSPYFAPPIQRPCAPPPTYILTLFAHVRQNGTEIPIFDRPFVFILLQLVSRKMYSRTLLGHIFYKPQILFCS